MSCSGIMFLRRLTRVTAQYVVMTVFRLVLLGGDMNANIVRRYRCTVAANTRLVMTVHLRDSNAILSAVYTVVQAAV